MCVIKHNSARPCLTERSFLHPDHSSDVNITTGNCSDPVYFYELDVRNIYRVFLSKTNDTDVSNLPYPGEIWGVRPAWEIISKTVVFVPVILLGIIGNIILLHLILRSRRLRTVTNLLIANMAAADLATLVICPWLFMCSDFYQNFILGHLGCKTEGFFECKLFENVKMMREGGKKEGGRQLTGDEKNNGVVWSGRFFTFLRVAYFIKLKCQRQLLEHKDESTKPRYTTFFLISGALLLTAVYNLCAISYDRLTAIVLPCEARLTIRGAHIVMITSWILGIILAVPLIVYRTYEVRHWLNYDEKYCIENMHILPTYWHIIITLLVWVPLAVMAICYTAIFVKLDRYEQEVIRRGREHPSIVNLKSRVARMMYIIVSVFIICRLPFTVFVFWRNQKIRDQNNRDAALQDGGHLIDDDENVSNGFIILWSMSHYLIFSNAAINPIIYGLTNENFKREFRDTQLSNWLFGPVPSTTANSGQQSLEKVKKVPLTCEPSPILQATMGEKNKVWFVEPKCVMVKTDITDCLI